MFNASGFMEISHVVYKLGMLGILSRLLGPLGGRHLRMPGLLDRLVNTEPVFPNLVTTAQCQPFIAIAWFP